MFRCAAVCRPAAAVERIIKPLMAKIKGEMPGGHSGVVCFFWGGGGGERCTGLEPIGDLCRCHEHGMASQYLAVDFYSFGVDCIDLVC